MDQAVLVKSDRDIEARVAAALVRARIPLTLCSWHYLPELEEWQLIIATPWYDSRGPRATYTKLVDALTKAGLYEEVRLRRVYMKSPNDPLVKALVREAKEQKEGRIYILKHGDAYVLTFPSAVAISGAGGPIPSRNFPTLNDLKQFLHKDLEVGPSSMETALEEINRTGSGSIYPVEMTTRQVRLLGLA